MVVVKKKKPTAVVPVGIFELVVVKQKKPVSIIFIFFSIKKIT